MAILSAKQFRDRETCEQVLDIGGGDQIVVRRPDIDTLVLENLLPMPLLATVVKMVADWNDKKIEDVTEDMLKGSPDMVRFVDLWVRHACVTPRVVQPPKDWPDDTPYVAPEGAVLLTDITLATKTLIFQKSFSEPNKEREAATEAAKDFPEHGASAGTGPDVQAVRPAPVVDLVHS